MPFDGTEYRTGARQILALLGENGERWRKDVCWDEDIKAGCLIGALGEATCIDISENFQGDRYLRLMKLLMAALEHEVSDFGLHHAARRGAPTLAIGDFNDSPETTFADIRRVLDRMHELEIAELTKAS